MKVVSASLTTVLLAASANALGFGAKPPPQPETDMVKGFDWKDPFASKTISSFEPTCESKGSFEALEFSLHDLMKKYPEGLLSWNKGLKKVFSDREYPGSWAGWDKHLHDRSILLMEYKAIPLEVREWIEEQSRTDGNGKGLFAVFEKPKDEEDLLEDTVAFPKAEEVDRSQDESKVAIFAPGAIYPVLPLWVAGGSKCKSDLLDLTKYKIVPEDGSVIGWPKSTKPGKKEKEMKFDVKVQALKAKPSASAPESAASEEAVRDEL